MKTGTDLPTAPPLIERDGSGGGSEWVELVRAKDDIDAHLVSGLLTEAGIESRHVRDNRAPVWLGTGALEGSLRVMVRKIDFEDARLLLAETALEAPSYERDERPRREPPGGRTFWWVIAIAVGILIAILITLQALDPTIACQLPALCES